MLLTVALNIKTKPNDKTVSHDITEMLLTVALNIKTKPNHKTVSQDITEMLLKIRVITKLPNTELLLLKVALNTKTLTLIQTNTTVSCHK